MQLINRPETDGYISRNTLHAITELPKKAQTALLKFLVARGPLDELTGDAVIRAALRYAGSEGVVEASPMKVKQVASRVSPVDSDDIDIDMLRTIQEADGQSRAGGGGSREAAARDVSRRS